jgi:CHAT domain-containing protein/tetratricopeptide (TPR) repeat protein
MSALAINQRDGRKKLAALNIANLAGVASDLSDYSRADSLFTTALALQKQTGDEAERAFTLHDYARLQIRRGDYENALASLDEALRINDRTGAAAEAVSVLGDIAIAENALGHPEKAVISLQQSEQRARATRLPDETRAEIAIANGDLSFEFGNYAAAETSYAVAERLFISAGKPSRAAGARYGRATVQYQRGDYDQALRLTEQSQVEHLRAGDIRAAALTLLLKASIQQTRGDVADARKTILDAQKILHRARDATGEASTLVMLGNLDLAAGAERNAVAAYKNGLSKLGRERATDVRWRLHAGLAMALRKMGDLDGSAKEFREAIGMTESLAARMRVPARRFGFLTDKWSTYAELSLLEQARGRASEAFAVSERLRAREMVDMLSRGRFGPAHTLTAREQDYRRRVDEIASGMEHTGNENSSLREPVRVIPLRDSGQTRLVKAQTEYSRVLNEIRATNPGYVSMVSASTVSGRDVSRHLASDEVLLEYLLGDSTCAVFVVTRDTLVALNLPVSRESLSDLVAFTRHSLEKPDDRKSRPLWNPPLERMYRELIDPVENRGYLRGKRRLVIVPHGDLHFLSFGALQSPRTHRFLIEQFEIGYAPSATVWMQLRNRKPVSRTRRILAMAPHISELPASKKEVSTIGDIYGRDAIVLTGTEASEGTLRSNLARVGIVHLATFGVMNKRNPLFSFVRLARANGSDGRLEVNKVYGLGMTGQLIILSACQTALGSGINGDMPPGDDWVGLVQAFLQGGAGGVLASLWPVDDSSTAFLMQRFHKKLAAGTDAVTAIAAAQREMLGRERTRSPFYWAAFVINGDGSTR